MLQLPAAGGLQSLDDDLADALNQLETEVRVAVALDQQRRSAERDGGGRLERPRLKMPGERRNQPGPAEHVTAPDGLDLDMAAVGAGGFQRHRALLDQIKSVRRFPFTKDHFAGLEGGLFGAWRDEGQMFWTHAAEKGVVNDARGESFHKHVCRFNVLASDRRRQEPERLRWCSRSALAWVWLVLFFIVAFP